MTKGQLIQFLAAVPDDANVLIDLIAIDEDVESIAYNERDNVVYLCVPDESDQYNVSGDDDGEERLGAGDDGDDAPFIDSAVIDGEVVGDSCALPEGPKKSTTYVVKTMD